jgi:hypothetical protein
LFRATENVTCSLYFTADRSTSPYIKTALHQPGKQIELIRSSNPLPDRIPEAFWSAIPPEPGVYRFYDEAGNVLYVGKSLNIRKRLFSYRSAGRSSVSRKIIRMIRSAAYISYECCSSDTEAIIEENNQIRLYRPVFNSANKHPENYYFIHVQRPEPDSIRIAVRMSAPDDIRSECYGAFKGHARVRTAAGAINRTLWLLSVMQPVSGRGAYPRDLVRVLTPNRYYHPFGISCDSLFRLLCDYLSGQGDAFLNVRESITRYPDSDSRFGQQNFERDTLVLRDFFQIHTQPCFQIRKYFHIRDHLIPQSDYDDLMAEADDNVVWKTDSGIRS